MILTNDKSASRVLESIAQQAVREGLGDHADVVVELDRARAIDLAVAAAKTGDVVLVAGKGHETTQTIGTATVPFSDADECRKAVVRAGFTPRGTGGPGSRDTR
ncbi:MAG: hypothetical protein U0169_18195 [Polyangiaceae bacterium]